MDLLDRLDKSSPVFDADMVDGEPSDPLAALPWSAARAMKDDELSERQAWARLRAQLTGEEHQPIRIGRFTLLRKLGAGGMGTVHAAYDAELERQVAIKVLHTDACTDEEAQHRLIREAQAQARLSHPNLVPVFEVGRFEDQIFLAMELVDGITIAEWVAQAPRSWRQISSHWLDIARALAAVHAEGLVHRDIKPNNVLVGDDGRARLVDFGLVRGQASTIDDDHTRSSRSSPTIDRSSRLDQVVTQSKAMVGTPAYMAPEVRAGKKAGPLADQYSLCVSIYETLTGERPFGRHGLRLDGGTPPRRSLPRAMHRLLLRGLAEEPTERFGDMPELVDALGAIVERRRQRRLAIGAGLLGAIALGGVTMQALLPAPVERDDPCAGLDDELDEVWNEQSRATLRRGLLATEVPYARALSDWAERSMDEVAQQWLATRRDACEAHAIDHTLSAAGLARAVTCLEEQRDALGTALDGMGQIEADGLPQVAAVFDATGVPAECLRLARLQASVEPPPREQQAAVEALRSTLTEIRLGAIFEGSRPHRQRAVEAHELAQGLGYVPLQAEASLVLGLVLLQAEEPEARAMLDEAASLSEEVGDLVIREHALRGLTRFALDVLLDEDEAHRALNRDLAVVARLGNPALRRAAALEIRASLSSMTGDFDSAESDLREAIALQTELGLAHVGARIASWYHLANLLAGRGRTDEAQRAFAAADRLATNAGLSALADSQGNVLRGHGELLRAMAMMNTGRLGDAQTWLAWAAVEIDEAYGSMSVPMSRVHMAQASLAMRQGRIDDVVMHAQTADAIVRRWLGPDHSLRSDALSAMGTAAFHEGDAARATAIFEESLRLAESTRPPTDIAVAGHRSNLGEALILAGDDARARPLLEQALAAMERTLHGMDPMLSYPSHGLAEISWRSGNLDDAARHAQRALRIREHHRDNPPELARTRWLLAQIEIDRGHSRTARTLAEAAHAEFQQLGPAFADQAQQIARWLQSDH